MNETQLLRKPLAVHLPTNLVNCLATIVRQTATPMRWSVIQPFIAMLANDKKVYDEMFTIEIINLEEMLVAYYPHQGDYLEIGAVFEKLFMYGVSQNWVSQQTSSFGLYYDDPQSVDQSAIQSKACATIPDGVVLQGDDAPESLTIAAGRYVTLLFKGSYAELAKPYNWFFGEWLPSSGYEAAGFPPMEEYVNEVKETPQGQAPSEVTPVWRVLDKDSPTLNKVSFDKNIFLTLRETELTDN